MSRLPAVPASDRRAHSRFAATLFRKPIARSTLEKRPFLFLCSSIDALAALLAISTGRIFLFSRTAHPAERAPSRQMSTMASRSHLIRLPEQGLRRAALSSKKSCMLWQSSRALSSSALGSQRTPVLTRKSLSLLNRYGRHLVVFFLRRGYLT